MRRNRIYQEMSRDIASRLKSEGVIDEDEYYDIVDEITQSNFSGLFSNISNLGDYKTLAEHISSWDGVDNPEITVGNNYYATSVAQENKKSYKEISIYDDTNHFACITSGILSKLKTHSDTLTIQTSERIWACIYDDQSKRDEFWDMLRTNVADKFLIVSDSLATTDEEKWRLYSFGYLLFSNKMSGERDSALSFNKGKEFSNNITLQPGKKYEQYFEVYELMSESHYCDDVLSRFLNMYQILENMCYRRHLVNLSNGSFSNNKFVRLAITKITKASKAENEEVPKGIAELFPSLITELPYTSFLQPHKDFILKEYGISISVDLSSKTIAKVIYAIRNSIVHNKATELHFSFANVDEYRDIISLISLIIEKVEPMIINRINNVTADHPLEYSERTYNVY